MSKDIKQIKWKDWLRIKGLKSERWPKSGNELLPIFLAEKGFNEEAIKSLIAYKKANEKKWSNFEKNIETYTPIVVTVLILLADNLLNFLSKDWRIIIFVLLGFEVLVIFIKNTVKKTIKENREE